jgi:hypothetical protein
MRWIQGLFKVRLQFYNLAFLLQQLLRACKMAFFKSLNLFVKWWLHLFYFNLLSLPLLEVILSKKFFTLVSFFKFFNKFGAIGLAIS